MDVQGGVVERPLVKIYNPTYWAAVRFAHIVDPSTGRGLALFMGGPASVSATNSGVLECVALRNAPMERAYRVLPIPTAFPAYGTDFGEHSFEFAAGFTWKGDWRDNGLHAVAEGILADPSADTRGITLFDVADRGIKLGGKDVAVTALKRAHRGGGLIVRLQTFGPDRVNLSLRERPVKRAFLADARERDLVELPVDSGTVRVPFAGGIVTVRLLSEVDDA